MELGLGLVVGDTQPADLTPFSDLAAELVSVGRLLGDMFPHFILFFLVSDRVVPTPANLSTAICNTFLAPLWQTLFLSGMLFFFLG